ncbi:hypothetical protein [Alkanindiges illinoisensis]|uniref:hypothetical protein n=1 Tax=Alkanindiges illinoisensis TaxID=197183 RepID=UPI00047BC42B|nr:hypothetical protein [Alkanindiges illinoisensis]
MLTLSQFHQFVIQYGQKIGFEYSLFAVKAMYASYFAGHPTDVAKQVIAAFKEDISCLEARNYLLSRINEREDKPSSDSLLTEELKVSGHGTVYYYNQGCRCVLCCHARAEYWAKHKKERAA